MDKRNLQRELLKRFETDQKSLNTENFVDICKDNTNFLKSIIKEVGWPNEERFGRESEQSAWLIVQHSDFDIVFQEKCLNLIKSLPKTKNRTEDYQYLKDRILVNKGKDQIFDTQHI